MVGTPFYVLCVAIARLVHGNNWISKILMLNEDLKEADVYVMLVIFVVTWLIQQQGMAPLTKRVGC
jgi:hypothetical protein